MGKNRNIGANDDASFRTGGRGGQTVSRPYAAEEGTRLPTESYCTTTIELIDSGVEAGTKKSGRRNGHGQSFPLRKSERSPCRGYKTDGPSRRGIWRVFASEILLSNRRCRGIESWSGRVIVLYRARQSNRQPRAIQAASFVSISHRKAGTGLDAFVPASPVV